MRPAHALCILPLLAAVPACNPGDAYCDRYVECRADEDDLDDDAAATCKEANSAFNDILAANSESDCDDLREKKDLYYGCLAALECDDFNDELTQPDKCEDEAQDYSEAFADARDDCFVSTSPSPQGGGQ